MQIQTVIVACTSASTGDLPRLQALYDVGVNMSQGDYDKRTPLHIAVFNNQSAAVKLLVEKCNVQLSPIDRWGATPLNDAGQFPLIKSYLLSKGAKYGTYTTTIHNPVSSLNVDNIADDQYRLFYAAYYGDVAMMENLRLLGWDANGQDYDGRTALGIAASEGNLDVVKYLIKKGADLNIQDARGNDPLDDAMREQRLPVVDYLVNEALVRNFCSSYEDGIL